MSYHIIIPARYASTRLKGKPLLEIKGKPLIQHAFETALNTTAKNIIVATDNEEIRRVAQAFSATVVMTSDTHQSGTDRIAEVARKLNLADNEIIVNLQGDEYGLPESLIEQVATNLFNHPTYQIATLCEPIMTLAEYKNPNNVKVVFDKDNTALYFSRAPIPADNNESLPEAAYRHIGLYAYKAGYLQTFTTLPPCQLEQIEALEQLRVLHDGKKIHVEVAVNKAGIGIDTAEDLALARAR